MRIDNATSPSYAQIIANYDAFFCLPVNDAAFMRARADRQLKAYRRWQSSKRPLVGMERLGTILAIRAQYYLARRRANVAR